MLHLQNQLKCAILWTHVQCDMSYLHDSSMRCLLKRTYDSNNLSITGVWLDQVAGELHQGLGKQAETRVETDSRHAKDRASSENRLLHPLAKNLQKLT